MKPRHNERGSAAVEVTVVVPLLIMLVLALAGAWRIGWARAQLVEAASAGARAATLASSSQLAVQQATTAIEFDLATMNVHCSELSIEIDAAAFAGSPGTHDTVSTDLGCRLDLADLLVPGMPGSVQLHAHASEALDVLRERRP